jgi:SAM-dependent methyltransferase
MKSKAAELLAPNTFIELSCPGCYAKKVAIFYDIRDLPVHSVLLLNTREEALNYPKGNIALGFCWSCGLVSNYAFDASLHEYSAKYESSQSFSPTFNSFSNRLAEFLIDQYGLRNKNIIEIGCGQGEFISLLVQLGGNHGIGFDPAYEGSRSYNIPEIPSSVATISNSREGLLNREHSDSCNGCVTFVSDFYGEKYRTLDTDFICCKMTLEHIHDTSNFIRNVRNSLQIGSEAVVFFQIPEFTRILDELAFWDIYYEHCSYFSPGSLARLFRSCGFEVRDIWTDYDDQYLMIEAGPNGNRNADHPALQNDIEDIGNKIDYFSKNYGQKIDAWKGRINEIRKKGLKTILWGSSSKSVAFLTTLKISYNDIEYVVDINPHRQGSYMAGTGQKIVSPEFLLDYKPEIVIVMNPIYSEEIRKQLESMRLEPEIITVNDV